MGLIIKVTNIRLKKNHLGNEIKEGESKMPVSGDTCNIMNRVDEEILPMLDETLKGDGNKKSVVESYDIQIIWT